MITELNVVDIDLPANNAVKKENLAALELGLKSPVNSNRQLLDFYSSKSEFINEIKESSSSDLFK
jgi:hypothetical protein